MRLLAVLAVVVSAACALASTAGAGKVDRFTIHEEYDFVVDGFCDTQGLSVRIVGVLDMRVHIVPRGPDQLLYFLQHGTQSETLTANGTSLTSLATVNEKDLHATDNGDGTVTVLIVATGNAALYDEAGTAIARNPGQTRLEITFDENGNEIPGSRRIARESTGRSDDFCAAAIPALTASTS